MQFLRHGLENPNGSSPYGQEDLPPCLPKMAPAILSPFAVLTHPAPTELWVRALVVHLTQRKWARGLVCVLMP